MDATEALTTFLRRALSERVDRYVQFASKAKTREKFLRAIDHDLEACLDSSMAVPVLPPAALDLPAFLYAPPKKFGLPVPALRAVLESGNDSFLAISRDGRAAVYSPEAYLDSRLCYFWP